MKIFFSFLTIVFCISLTGCCSNRTISDEKESSTKPTAPGQCRLTAQVIKIDATLSNGSSKDPCSKAPCTAWVKIKSIVGCGSGITALNLGDTLKTKFSFTLNPTTKETFLTLIENFPGLIEGSLFEADFQLLPSNPSNPNKERLYLVNTYKKIE